MSDRKATTRWGLVAVLVLAGVATATHIGKVPPAIGSLRADLGMSLTVAGWVLSTFAAMGALTAAAAGGLADLLTPRRAAVGGLLLLAAASAAGAAVSSPALLIAVRLVESAAGLMTVVAVPGLLVAVVRPADARLAFAVWGAWVPLGIALMMVVSPAVIGWTGWRGLWLVAAAATLAAGALLWWTTRRLDHGRRGVHRLEVMPVLRSRGAWLLAAAFAVYSMTYHALVGFFPVLLVERLGLAPAAAVLLAALVVLANAAGNVAAGPIGALGWPRWRTMTAAFAAILVTAPLVFVDLLPDLGRFLVAALFSFSGGLIPGTILGAAPLFAPRPQAVGAISGFMVQGANVGQLLGPPLVAAAVTYGGGWSTAALVIVAAALSGLAASFAIRGLER